MENNNNSFVVTVTPITDNSFNTTTENAMQAPEKKQFKNQQGSIKTPKQSKEELEALMKITNTKFTHEIIDLLINHYVDNKLTPEQQSKFKILTDI